MNKINFKQIAWYAFDMGNSAHALLISTIGFSLYFKEYLYKSNPDGNTMWAAITALVLLLSAVLSPILTSFSYTKNRRALSLLLTTLVCVLTTILLSTKISSEILGAILLYVFSALGYYLALPLYNSYMLEVSEDQFQITSSKGWALGYLGGIVVTLIVYFLGYLNADVQKDTETYKQIFLIAGLFNAAFSFPMLIYAFIFDKKNKNEKSNWKFTDVINVFNGKDSGSILKLFVIYWLIGEVAVIVTYFFAIFMKQYAFLETKEILIYSLFGQFIAIITTWKSGFLAEKFGLKKILTIVTFIWIAIPISLYGISQGLTIWISVFLIGLVIGAYHSLIRGKIAEITNQLIPNEKGSLFGFLEVAGRFSQVIGPLLISFITIYFELNIGILFVTIFPIIALFVIWKFKW